MTATVEIEALSGHFSRAATGIFGTSPLYQALCPAIAADPQLLDLLTGRRPGQQPSFLLFGAVHQLLLDGAAHPLRRYYPSVVADPDTDTSAAGPVFADFCRQFGAPLAELIRTRLVQSNVVRRAIAVRYALHAIGQRCTGPVHLVEVGASAGLLLNVDRYRYRIGGRDFGPPDAAVTLDSAWRGAGTVPDLDAVPAIASRTGVDLHPIDLADDRERRWLQALVWPEHRSAAALLDAAIGEARAVPLRIIAGDAAQVCPALGADLPGGEPRVVFHAATRMHVPGEQRAAFDEAIDSLGATGPLFHAWLEPPEAAHQGFPVAARGVVALHGPGDDAATALVRVDGHLQWLESVA
jgi:hypothetical protein